MHRGSAYLPLALIHHSTLVRNTPGGMEAVPDAVVSSLPTAGLTNVAADKGPSDCVWLATRFYLTRFQLNWSVSEVSKSS